MTINAAGMEFINYANRILSMNDHEELHGAASEKQIQKKITSKKRKDKYGNGLKIKICTVKL